MTRYESPIDATSAECILNGEPAGPRRLVGILRSASAGVDVRTPVRGEDEAVLAFMVARIAPSHVIRSTPAPVIPRRPALAWVLTVKVATVLFALAAGGVAFAAGVGAISQPAPRHQAGSMHSTSIDPAHQPGAGSTRPIVVGAHEMDVLCRVLHAASAVSPASADHNPHTAARVAAAGGVSRIVAFCASHPGGANPDGSVKSEKHDARPTVGHRMTELMSVRRRGPEHR